MPDLQIKKRDMVFILTVLKACGRLGLDLITVADNSHSCRNWSSQ